MQKLVKDFIKPDDDGMYSIPKSGLISKLGIDMYTNSCHGTGIEANVEFGVSRDSSGFAEVVASRNINAGEELLLPYEVENSIRVNKSICTQDGQERLVPLQEDIVNQCRVCREDLTSDSSGIVDIGCKCKDSTVHLKCANKWFGQHITIELKQHRPDDIKHDDVVNEWIPGASAKCEICQCTLSSDYCKQLLMQLASSKTSCKAIRNLAEKVKFLNPNPVSVVITEVPGRVRQPIYVASSSRCQERSLVGFNSVRQLSLGRQSRPDKRRRREESSLTDNHQTGDHRVSFQEGTKALFWMHESKKWEPGRIGKFVSANDRNVCGCMLAVCHCPKHTRGKYQYTIDGEDDESVDSYFSEYDCGIKVNGKSGKELWGGK